MADKRTVFEGMNFADAETRVPDVNPPLRFVPKKNESNRVKQSRIYIEG